MRKRITNHIESANSQGRSAIRERIDLLQNRIELLTGRDRVLMSMYLQNANSFRQMAKLSGVNEATIARRIYKIVNRLIDGEYLTCLRRRREFSSLELKVAKDYFVRGLSQRKIAKKRNCSLYHVRKTTRKIQQMVWIEQTSRSQR